VGRKPKSATEKAEEQKYLRQLGEHLKELREAKNLTPQDLADKLGVTPQYIYMIESGKAKPSESRLNEIARALGDLADEFLTTAIGHVEEEFATKLREAGLSVPEIEEAARRVSARVKEDVVSGKEPLRVSRGDAPEHEIWGALENEESIIAMSAAESSRLNDLSAADYAASVKEEFQVGAQKRRQSARPRPKPRSSGQVVKAGSDARIVVDRSLTREERRALQDIGRVIEHLLNR
jgi:transcriptional regulator with XRE-family HTH domain